MTNRYGKPVHFIHFPGKKRQKASAMRWIHACKRPAYQLSLETLTYHHFICSLHWIGEDGPTSENPFPLPADMNEEARNRLEVAFQKRRKQSHQTDGERECPETEPEPASSETENSLEEELEVADILLSFSRSAYWDSIKQDTSCSTNEMPENVRASSMIESDCVVTVEQGTQTLSLERSLRQNWIDRIREHPMYYTGLKSRELLYFLFDLVKDKADRISLWRGSEPKGRNKNTRLRKLSTWEEFLLTLMRIRRGIDTEMTAHLFGISVNLASNIFITWVLFLDKELQFLRRFSSVKCNEKHIPKSMRDRHGKPNTFVKDLRCIIDAVDFQCETPSLPVAQRKLYSAYYNTNTYKLLIGCTPNGYINYISKLWSGNVSDQLLVKKSGFLDHLNPGGIIMADKGFRIRHMLTLKSCSLRLPPGLKGGQLKPRASTVARRVSNIRIHVERAIRRLKTFRILSQQLKLTQKSHMDSIVNVCVSLANLGNDLVAD